VTTNLAGPRSPSRRPPSLSTPIANRVMFPPLEVFPNSQNARARPRRPNMQRHRRPLMRARAGTLLQYSRPRSNAHNHTWSTLKHPPMYPSTLPPEKHSPMYPSTRPPAPSPHRPTLHFSLPPPAESIHPCSVAPGVRMTITNGVFDAHSLKSFNRWFAKHRSEIPSQPRSLKPGAIYIVLWSAEGNHGWYSGSFIDAVTKGKNCDHCCVKGKQRWAKAHYVWNRKSQKGHNYSGSAPRHSIASFLEREIDVTKYDSDSESSSSDDEDASEDDGEEVKGRGDDGRRSAKSRFSGQSCGGSPKGVVRKHLVWSNRSNPTAEETDRVFFPEQWRAEAAAKGRGGSSSSSNSSSSSSSSSSSGGGGGGDGSGGGSSSRHGGCYSSSGSLAGGGKPGRSRGGGPQDRAIKRERYEDVQVQGWGGGDGSRR
jgi:hypothetical protein